LTIYLCGENIGISTWEGKAYNVGPDTPPPGPVLRPQCFSGDPIRNYLFIRGGDLGGEVRIGPVPPSSTLYDGYLSGDSPYVCWIQAENSVISLHIFSLPPM
jgi:hypothetical protein